MYLLHPIKKEGKGKKQTNTEKILQITELAKKAKPWG
jgi:hypothetical protein